MAKREALGLFEQMVLTAILALDDDAYGISIHKRVKALAHPRSVSLGAIYVTLDRLEDKGFVDSWLSDPTPERGGRSKRRYKLQPPGKKALEQSAAAGRRLWDAVAEALGPSWAQSWERRLRKEQA